jgi:mRNA-degrading endonuclease toxin of MazEF toxin-antitoxin module
MADNVQTLLLKRVGKVIGRAEELTMRRVEASVAAFLGLGPTA